MEFATMDLFEAEPEAGRRGEAEQAAARVAYRPRVLHTDPHACEPPQQDDNGLKMLADRLYYTREYARALDLYTDLLQGAACRASLALRRDLTESVARCCLALGDAETALQHALAFHAASPRHPDHQMVGLSLLLDVSEAQSAAGPSPAGETRHLGLLVRALTLQPGLPRLWLQLGHHYRRRGQPCPRREAASLRRARTLLASVLRTAGPGLSFLDGRNRETMAGLDSRLGGLLGEAGEEEEQKPDGPEEAAEEEFQDLGTSVRKKQMEEVLEKDDRADSEAHDDDDDFVIMRFEQRWF